MFDAVHPERSFMHCYRGIVAHHLSLNMTMSVRQGAHALVISPLTPKLLSFFVSTTTCQIEAGLLQLQFY